MLLGDVLIELEAIAPLRLAEPWDNVGLLAGDRSRPAAAALLAIDYTPAVAAEARALGCDLVIAYHPPIFEALKRIVAPGLIHDAIRDGIALYSPHTALDAAPGGTNDFLADVLGLADRASLKPSALAEPPAGMGRIGALTEPAPRAEILARIKRGLAVESLLVAAPPEGDGLVRRAAVCAGACGAHLDDALAQGADLYLTGEIRHHDALRAARAGLTVVCALHSNSERGVLPRVAARLAERLPALRVSVSAADRDPFSIL
ncbi:MAG: Nif3-like dinuclear metal center hexameric protein [Polyangiaceae bacterium]|nr:Nif3-like dinuclear metal center hexameric protein [Polyangiaceae bacterium]